MVAGVSRPRTARAAAAGDREAPVASASDVPVLPRSPVAPGICSQYWSTAAVPGADRQFEIAACAPTGEIRAAASAPRRSEQAAWRRARVTTSLYASGSDPLTRREFVPHS